MFNKDTIYLEVAKLHIESLKTGFLPTLGIKFLSLMYRCIDEGNFTTLILKYKKNKLVGFVSGSLGSANLHRLLLHHPFKLTIVLIPILFNLNKLRKLFNLLKHMSSYSRSKYPKEELLTICVNSKYNNQGIGKGLYEELINYFRSKSVSKFTVIVGKSLKANSFYLAQGAKLVGEINVHSTNYSNVYVQKI
ncbi:GNAT family N-acetyltransferase [Candidatus Pelagibacter sp. HIMB1495]|uniref:GNAT family N-acetyltransferase n=1 Tax=unclassified Candidatus Pelagibacter TaxID=2647897 RepID=UPI003F85A90B